MATWIELRSRQVVAAPMPVRAARTAAIAALALLAAGPAGAVPSYGPEPQVAPTPVERRTLAVARARLGDRARTSGALVLAARELAARAAAGDPDPVSRARVRGALARALGYDAAPAAVLAVASPDEAPAAIARALPRTAATHLGAGALERDGKAYVVLLLSDRPARLEPFPRDVAAGARAVLAGTLDAPLARARVFVTRPSGAVDEAGGASGRGFRLALDFPGPGRHVVALVAEGEGGPEVAALLTVSAGGAPLDPPAPRGGAGAPPDGPAAEAAVLEALNATRRRQGLPPLAADAAVAAVARRHSEAMAAAGRVAHAVPGSPAAGERLRRAGVPYRRSFENVARAGAALDAHAAVEESPAHLGNVLRREPTRVGIGVAAARLPSGDPTVYLTEIFVEPPDDGAASRLAPDARVREVLWRERARLALRPLTADAALDALARDAASAMRARDGTDADGLGERALALRREVAAVDVFVAASTEEAVRSANLRDPRFARVGVGVAAGDSRRFGKGRLWIAVVYTD
jgi:uncharacterized protein YkwD